MKQILAAIALVIGLTGCSDYALGISKSTSEAVPAQPMEVTEASVAQSAVAALSANCPSLDAYASDPANWLAWEGVSGPAPYTLSLKGEGSSATFKVSPGSPEASLTVHPEFAQVTNYVLGVWNCTGIAWADEGSATVPEQAPQQSANTFVLPNFVGAVESQVRDWAFQNGIQARFYFDYGIEDTYVPCTSGAIGPVTRQSPNAGSTVTNDAGTQITIYVDCRRENWVQ